MMDRESLESIRQLLLSRAADGDWTALKLYLELEKRDEELDQLRRNAECERLRQNLQQNERLPVVIVDDIPARGKRSAGKANA